MVALTMKDLAGRKRSDQRGEWMYVFKPVVAGMVVYVKLIVRTNCVLISFHRDEAEDEDQ